MADVSEIKELNIFREGGATYSGLSQAENFFKKYVDSTESLEQAFIWLTEEIGELGRIIRTKNEERYKDGIGDIVMWTFSIARLLGVEVSESLEYSTKQLVAKGYTKLEATGDIDPPLDPDQ